MGTESDQRTHHVQIKQNEAPHARVGNSHGPFFAHRFLDVFQELGVDSAVGRKDVTEGLKNLDDGLNETAPYILGKDVQVNVDSPYDPLRSIKHFVLQLIGNVCLMYVLLIVGSFTWIAVRVGFARDKSPFLHLVDEVQSSLIQGFRAV